MSDLEWLEAYRYECQCETIEKKIQHDSITEEKYSAEVLHEKYGFCEEGMKEFAQICGLDIDGEYTAKELYAALELEALKKYPDEVIQIFGKNTLDKFGGVEGVLAEDTISLVLREEFIDAKTLHLLACDFAEDVLHVWEKEYPEDNRPRRAIEVKRLWIEEEYAS